MSSSTISENIRNSLQILTEMYGISEAELCEKTQISQSTLWRLQKGSVDPRASTLNTIASFFNVTVDQLLGNQPITKDNIGRASGQSKSSTYIPVFSIQNTNELRSKLGLTTPSNWDNWIDVEPSINGKCFGVKVVGESMWPDFTEGTLIIVDPSKEPKHRNYVLCQLHQDNEIIFRQLIIDGSEKLLKPINYNYKSKPLTNDDKILGVIIQAKNNYLG